MVVRKRSIRVPGFMTKPSEAGLFKTTELGGWKVKPVASLAWLGKGPGFNTHHYKHQHQQCPNTQNKAKPAMLPQLIMLHITWCYLSI